MWFTFVRCLRNFERSSDGCHTLACASSHLVHAGFVETMRLSALQRSLNGCLGPTTLGQQYQRSTGWPASFMLTRQHYPVGRLFVLAPIPRFSACSAPGASAYQRKQEVKPVLSDDYRFSKRLGCVLSLQIDPLRSAWIRPPSKWQAHPQAGASTRPSVPCTLNAELWGHT